MQPDSRTLTLRDYLVPIVKRRWMILGLVAVITAIVSVYYSRRPVTYTAATSVFIGPSSDPALGVAASEPTLEAVANEATLLTSVEDAAVVAKRIGWTGSAGALAGSVSATPSATTNFLSITAQSSTAAEAARIANGFAQQFIAQNTAAQVTADTKQITELRRQLHSARGADATAQRSSIESQIQSLQVAASSAVGSAKQVNVAQGGVASSHSVIEYGVLAAIGALIGGILLAFLLERLDPRLKGVQHTEMIYKHPVLATVWHDAGIDHFVDGRPALSPRSREAFRDLRIGLHLAAGTADIKTIVVSSAVPDEGKTTVARNLALALSEGGRRVVLVDADLRKPSLHRKLGMKNQRGLAELLDGTRTLDEVTIEVPINLPKPKNRSHGADEAIPASPTDNGSAGAETTAGAFAPKEGEAAATQGVERATELNGHTAAHPPGFVAQPSLFYIPSGAKPPNPQGVLESEAFRMLIDDLKRSFDAVVLDSTPLTLVSDAIPVIRSVDALLLVARSSTDTRTARYASEIIQRVPGANVIGLVVNDVPEAAAAAYGKGYGYGYYGYGYGNRYGAYGYGYSEDTDAQSSEDSCEPDLDLSVEGFQAS
jgi:succinoglycan biosynthesis transport protein ExoP